MKKIYFSCIDWVCKIIQYLVSVILVFMALLMFAEVVRRYLFGLQFGWSEELIRYLAVWVAFLGGAAAYHEKSLVCFDMIRKKLEGKAGIAAALLSNIIILAFLVLICYLGIKNILSPSVYRQSGVGLKVSMAIPYAAIPAGTGLMALFTLNNCFHLIGECVKEGIFKKAGDAPC